MGRPRRRRRPVHLLDSRQVLQPCQPLERPEVVKLRGGLEHVDKPMTDREALSLLHGCCTAKRAIITVAEAAAVAKACTARSGEAIRHYRCPFSCYSEHVHWHIGHPPTVPQLERLALAIRHLAQHRHLIA